MKYMMMTFMLWYLQSTDSKNSHYQLLDLKSNSKVNNEAHAEIKLKIKGKEHVSSSNGGGAVDATFKGIEDIVNSNSKLSLYSVNNITDGTDSLGEVTVRLEKNDYVVNGLGADSDIIIASAKAYIDALNKLNIYLSE